MKSLKRSLFATVVSVWFNRKTLIQNVFLLFNFTFLSFNFVLFSFFYLFLFFNICVRLFQTFWGTKKKFRYYSKRVHFNDALLWEEIVLLFVKSQKKINEPLAHILFSTFHGPLRCSNSLFFSFGYSIKSIFCSKSKTKNSLHGWSRQGNDVLSCNQLENCLIVQLSFAFSSFATVFRIGR